ncbi:8-oxo-dGTP pyrophosphatase MutT, NUDIX family [Roseovarius nanhaiticus]|uniref:8-oxo-dGTP pyrophosphatase MutT, NUDIX family n=1 Tax=Roseovarius nanhaiticus TaxID=573024 RepID=A0A1N7FFV2_9RHOB|nr:NUDIX hydrolase [Roseovarius nanhaiticus]SEK55539.1 8-oxo-dGTP pyrophosphatase MutT, NUDIX family [Roseovarius nanhaiticus]SIR99202.1 8-oxo-dGTP pyrophosphatase MutT, NUDIX family [Roseovarius nanhaiticus]
MTPPDAPIRNAATVIVLRKDGPAPSVLMGQRGASAAFMPSKFVFPGGAIDPDDATVPLAGALPDICAQRLCEDCAPDLGHALAAAAIRELWEEAGLIIGRSGTWTGAVPPDWASFAARGHLPDAGALQFVFRAITPPGRPRRFDARFFLIDADHIVGDPDDFSAATDELSHLQWVPLPEARRFDLPFITEVVLAEVAARAHDPAPPASVPFFRNDDEESLFLRLSGRGPLQSRMP